jgi:queuine tRNA-ribosyltransferase
VSAASSDDAGCEVVTTRSGALAMRDRGTGELMHPVVGPLVEADTLYVGASRLEARLVEAPSLREGEPLVLLDVGLGAGSNAIAAWKLSERMPASARRLEMISFDHTTSALELALSDEHAAAFGFEGAALRAARMLLSEGRHETRRTVWRLEAGELPSTLGRVPERSSDVVFWDPFSPRANPALWTAAAFAALRRVCRAGATVHTYSAATATRSALLLAGFAVGVGDAGGVGKPSTQAAVGVHALARPLGRRWLERLARSDAPFPADAPADALARVAALPQFSVAPQPG